jgi:hydroxypyruvate isomerase
VIRGYSAHLNTLYPTLPQAARPAAAAADGFSFVEMWDAPVGDDADVFLRALDVCGLRLTSVNTPAGPDSTSFGTLGDPAAAVRWRAEFADTLWFARAAAAYAVNVLVGRRLPAFTRQQQRECVAANLSWAIDQLGPDDPVLLVEPLNAADRPSPLVHRLHDAVDIITDLGSPKKLALLFDAYHMAQEEPDLLSALDAALAYVGHVQIADYPGRGQPGTGTLPICKLLEALNDSDYQQFVGLEYVLIDEVSPLAWRGDDGDGPDTNYLATASLAAHDLVVNENRRSAP